MPPRKKKMEAPAAMPAPCTMPHHDRLMHPHWEEMGRKVLMTLIGILALYAIVYVGTLIRNNIQEYPTIGYTDRMERSITLEAQGQATVTPDVAETTIGMRSRAATVEEAQANSTEVMNNLIAKVKRLGIEDADIQTANYNVYPYYNYTESDGSVLEGYEVSQSVTVKIRDTDRADQVLGLAGETGVNSVSGLRFTIDDTEVYLSDARKDAMREIARKAEELEVMLGVDIISVISYNEYQGGGYGYPVYERSYAALDSSAYNAAPDIEPGTEDVLLNVSVTFEIR